MHLKLTCDANEESGVGSVVDELSGPLRKHFTSKEYGGGLNGIVIVLMCREPELQFKQRIRYSKSNRYIYMDVMLNLDELKCATKQVKKEIIVAQIINEVPVVLKEYSALDFNQPCFIEDLRAWLSRMNDSGRVNS